MGSSLSVTEQSLVEASDSPLRRLAGATPVPLDDKLWLHDLDGVRFAMGDLDAQGLQAVMDLVCEQMAVNNFLSGNLRTLMTVVIQRLDTLSTEVTAIPPTVCNLIFLARMFIKYIIETQTIEQVMGHFAKHASVSTPRQTVSVSINAEAERSLPVLYSRALVQACIRLPPTKGCFEAHVEIVKSLIILCSTQMLKRNSAGESESDADLFLDELISGDSAVCAATFLQWLFERFTDRLPDNFAAMSPPSVLRETSILQRLTSRMTTFIWLPFQLYQMLFSVRRSYHPLSDNCALLLLILIHQRPEHNASWNPYYVVCSNFIDDDDFETAVSPSRGSGHAIIKLPFFRLYEAFGESLNREWSAVLLFSVIHANRQFCEFVYSKSDLDVVVLPLLESIHNARDLSSNHVYVALTVLLILSEDPSFSDNCHRRLYIHNVPWFRDRPLTNISLGSLIMLVLLRTIQQNLSAKDKDGYLHSNCLAVLANMAPYITNLHQEAATRLVGVLKVLAKRYARVSRMAEVTPSEEYKYDDHEEDLATYGDFIFKAIEIIQQCLGSNLADNIPLLYALLCEDCLLRSFEKIGEFRDVCAQISGVLEHFHVLINRSIDPSYSPRFDSARDGRSKHLSRIDSSRNSTMQPATIHQLSVSGVHAILRRHAQQQQNQAAAAPALVEAAYKYEETPESDQFFIPYIWNLIKQHSHIRWTPEGYLVAMKDRSHSDANVFDSGEVTHV